MGAEEIDKARNTRIADQINSFWQKKGLSANARPVLYVTGTGKNSHTYYMVKSNMRNGVPEPETAH